MTIDMKRRYNADYLAMMQSLLPKGKLWSRDPDSRQTQILKAEADEFVRIEERAFNLFWESITRQTTELLTEYESDFGLPENGAELANTVAERIEDIYSKMLEVGQLFPTYLEEQAFLKNYVTHIYEYAPFLVGISSVDDRIGYLNSFFFEALTDTYGLLGPFGNSFSTSFDNSPGTFESDNIDFLQYQTRSLDKLIEWINRIKQAHTRAWISWYNAGFASAFSWGFRSFPHHDGTVPITQFNSNFGDGFTSTFFTYDGTYLTGAFDNGFYLAFDTHFGGSFVKDAFGNSFNKEN